MKRLHSVIALIAIALPASAQPTDSWPKLTDSMRLIAPGQWINELGVSDEQRAKIQEIRERKFMNTEKHVEALQHLHEELKRVMAGEGHDEQARAIHRQMQEVKRELESLHFESMMAVRQLLTPEQRLRFVEAMRLRGRLGIDTK